SLARANARGRDWRGASSQRLVQPVQQPRPRLDRGDVDLLVMGMRAFAVDAEPVERRRVRRGEIAVGAAAGGYVHEIEAEFGCKRPRMLKQRSPGIALLVGRAVQLADHLHADALGA